jgi:hypothetical protein
VIFHDSKPIVTARRGIVSGHRARLDALTIKVTAHSTRDGAVHVTTSLDPEFGGWVYNPDQHPSSMQRLIELDPDQLPTQCVEEHALLTQAVHALHPNLHYTRNAS